jgi:hypothetical protein
MCFTNFRAQRGVPNNVTPVIGVVGSIDGPHDLQRNHHQAHLMCADFSTTNLRPEFSDSLERRVRVPVLPRPGIVDDVVGLSNDLGAVHILAQPSFFVRGEIGQILSNSFATIA